MSQNNFGVDVSSSRLDWETVTGDSTILQGNKGYIVPNSNEHTFNFPASNPDSSGKHPITIYGDTTKTTIAESFSTKAIVFDGDGDYLSIPRHDIFDFGSDDFVVECWINSNDPSEYKHFVYHNKVMIWQCRTRF